MNQRLDELNDYLSRSECDGLNDGDKQFLTEYVMSDNDYPVGRRLALGLMSLNDGYNRVVVSQKFINWLYSY
jgi:hypothetical protein